MMNQSSRMLLKIWLETISFDLWLHFNMTFFTRIIIYSTCTCTCLIIFTLTEQNNLSKCFFRRSRTWTISFLTRILCLRRMFPCCNVGLFVWPYCPVYPCSSQREALVEDINYPIVTKRSKVSQCWRRNLLLQRRAFREKWFSFDFNW